MIACFVGRRARGDEQNSVQPKLARRRSRRPQVPAMDRIEGAAKKRDIHRGVAAELVI